MRTFRHFREHPDGSVSVGNSKERLSIEEFHKLQQLMPGVEWFGFVFPRPEVITNPSYEPSPDHAEFLKNYANDPSKFLTFKKSIPNTIKDYGDE